MTHAPWGEYTRHLRHEETARAVIALWAQGEIRANSLWLFAYEDGGRAYPPRAAGGAHVRFTSLPARVGREIRYHHRCVWLWTGKLGSFGHAEGRGLLGTFLAGAGRGVGRERVGAAVRILVLYDYPPPPGGLATQGDLLFKGLQAIGVEVHAAHLESVLEKRWYYRWFKPDAVVGIGYWGQSPHIVLHPLRHRMRPVPWLVADGYVANFKPILNELAPHPRDLELGEGAVREGRREG